MLSSKFYKLIVETAFGFNVVDFSDAQGCLGTEFMYGVQTKENLIRFYETL